MDFKKLALLALLTLGAAVDARGEVRTVRSTSGGRWSEPSTWERGQVPRPGDRVRVLAGHVVTFDARVEAPIRSIHVAGTLHFDPDRDTLLTVGLIRVQAGDEASESGFDAHAGMLDDHPVAERPALLVGTSARPIREGRSALIRLAEVEGLDPESCPAIVCQGGRMEFHGAEVGPTWTKLASTAPAGESAVVLDRPVSGWKVGDRVIVTATRRPDEKIEERIPKVRDKSFTEERVIRAVDGPRLTLDAPLKFAHLAVGEFRGEVALLSRNVVVESANPDGPRGHTMVHRGSVTSISYAEFRHLGKPGKLGKYSLHFHQAGDSIRGASVIGASIWDSGNRWITVHGTNRLVIRDCVGYRSLGHGFFLEDGTEVDNIFDGNLAVQAMEAPSLPGQVLGFDRNEGAGFWWANSRNGFVRNVAAECDGYGFRFEAPTSDDFHPVLPVRGADGRTSPEDVRVQPFLRFDSNEAHSQRHYGVNLGGAPGHGSSDVSAIVGPDSSHPFAIRDLRIWDSHWAFTPATPGLLIDGLEIARSEFGFWRPNFDRHAYRKVTVYQCAKAYYEITGRPPAESRFPSPLDPKDDRPPVSVITSADPIGESRIRVFGASMDDGRVAAVRVNGREARPLVPDFSQWEAVLEWDRGRPLALTSAAEDGSGNREKTPHAVTLATPTDSKAEPPSTHPNRPKH